MQILTFSGETGMISCRVPGCPAKAARYGGHCNAHKSHARRHGEATQDGLTVADLKLWRTEAAAVMAQNAGSEAWPLLDERWLATIDECRAFIAATEAGKTFNSQQLKARWEVVRLAGEVTGRTVFETVMALYLIQEQNPRRFVSDRAFRFQLVRRCRGLTTVNAGEYYDHETRKVKRVYREMPPRATEVFAGIIVGTFGGAALALARRVSQAQEEKQQQAAKLARALEQMAVSA